MLFIYGSLLKPIQHPERKVIDQHCRFISEAKIQGELYEVDHYPGVIQTNQSIFVMGELYEILDDGELFDQLDDYEGCSEDYPKPHLYLRQKVEAYLPDNTTVDAWTYLYNLSVENLTRIESGDYLEYLDSLSD